MLTFLRSRTRGQRIALLVAVLVLVAALLVMLAVGSGVHRHGTDPTQPAQLRTPEITASARTASPPPRPTSAPFDQALPETESADVYAASVAKAFWDVNYGTTSRDAVLGFWRAQLALVLPAGTPAGTTLVQAQAAALSTIDAYLPSAPMWSTLAHDETTSSFTVTGVSEPPSWVEAISSGRIADPGLTAREVIGVQKIAYGQGIERRTTTQSQQLTVAMLCPPTTQSCSVELFPPQGMSGVSG